MHFTEIILRTIITFIVLLLFTRLLGRKQMSNLTFFNYITGISIGTIAASLSMDRSTNIWDASTALVGWVVLTLLIALIDIKSRKMRLILDGQPMVVIKNGQVMEKALKKLRLDMEQLTMMLREKSVFSITEVDYAILETDGKLSLLKKEGEKPPTKTDFNMPLSPFTIIPTDLIIDGKLIKENLEKVNVNEAWLKQQISAIGIPSMDMIFYAQLQKDGTLYVDLKDDPAKN
jgi:uncharacterized membrane protein YcaP (DUF421 family)